MVVSVENVTKAFKKEVVLRDVNMQMEGGRIYGLVGRNGSGKTVLMKCISGFLRPTRGRVVVDGKVIGVDVDFPESIGLMLETPGFIPYMSGLNNLRNLALIRGEVGDQEIRQTLELVGLDPDSRKVVAKYSLGMRQRLGIAQAIMEKPRLLVLDEPFNSLDEGGVDEMRGVLLRLKEEGTAILLASHVREDVEFLCDEVYRMHEHSVAAMETVTETVRGMDGK